MVMAFTYLASQFAVQSQTCSVKLLLKNLTLIYKGITL